MTSIVFMFVYDVEFLSHFSTRSIHLISSIQECKVLFLSPLLLLHRCLLHGVPQNVRKGT